VADALDYARGEIAVQREIIRATGNVAFELVLNLFARFPDDQPQVVSALYDQREHAPQFYDMVLDLIRSGDAARAREQMRVAFEVIDADWMTRHRPRTAPAAKPASARVPEAKTKTPKKAKRVAQPRNAGRAERVAEPRKAGRARKTGRATR
jgi:hypothetical protein